MKFLIKLLASVISSLICVVLIIIYAVLEAILMPSNNTADAWHHGALGIPFVFIAVILMCYSIGTEALNKGHESILNFCHYCSRFGVYLSLIFIFPVVVIRNIEELSILSSIYIIIITSAFVYFTLFIPSAIWWFVSLKIHNKSNQSEAQKTRSSV